MRVVAAAESGSSTPVAAYGMCVARVLWDFVNDECLPGLGIGQQGFWRGVAELISQLSPRNAQLLQRRDLLQRQIDTWHHDNPGAAFDASKYCAFLRQIGYLVTEGPSFSIGTQSVDPEIAVLAGPQLVVPLDNARYSLNAANARWGSLYDALYGTDVIADTDGTREAGAFSSKRAAKVVAYVRHFLDAHFALIDASHLDSTAYRITESGLIVELRDGRTTRLHNGTAFVGYQGDAASPRVILLLHHGLHVELHIDPSHPIGRTDPSGIKDVVLESALTTIQDCEDSVAAVDAQDKVRVYRNWLGLMRGTLTASFAKRDAIIDRQLNSDRHYTGRRGERFTLPGRSLMLVRNVGHFLMSDAITLDGNKVPETFIDVVVTSLIAMYDLRRSDQAIRNSRYGSVYIVKPKMHGPEEVAFADELFGRVEALLGMPVNTLKMGIMDEERRTSVNLMECIRAARNRCVFINTGFLDRTGDEIHTSMQAGPVVRKEDLKRAKWLAVYEQQNVDIGLRCGLPGKAQIGKGMWAMPDRMSAMVTAKIAHPESGATTAWVPSPTAATLHALHYHQVDVHQTQIALLRRERASLAGMLEPPLAREPSWSTAQIEEELNNNVQSILGYVVRWIDSGIGCSKVLDFYNVGLMEDRATLRISSQHIANWLHHGICTRQQVEHAMRTMAAIVDRQNASDPHYQPMAPSFDNNIAFAAAHELIFKAHEQPNGYTEVILHARRLQRKATSRE